MSDLLQIALVRQNAETSHNGLNSGLVCLQVRYTYFDKTKKVELWISDVAMPPDMVVATPNFQTMLLPLLTLLPLTMT